MPKKKTIPHAVSSDGKHYKCYFEYETYGEVRSKHGTDPDYLNSAVLIDFMVAGLKSKNPELTREVIAKARPPMIPAALDVKDAIQSLYYGDIDPAEEEEEKPKIKAE
jgi:hypothetical protein